MLSFKMKAGLVAVGTAMSLGVAAPANAAAILGLYDTGVDNLGNVIAAAGQADLHYTVTASPVAGRGLPGFVPQAALLTQHPSWSANDAAGSGGSGWITAHVGPDGVTAGKSGTLGQNGNTGYDFDYTITFTLGSLSAASAMITGNVQSDNFVRVLLNGNDIGGQAFAASPGNASAFRKFTYFGGGNGFFLGNNQVNTLTFRVTDYGVVSGLRVEGLMGTAVPEPATWAMLIVGFGLVAGQIRRRRRAGTLAIA